VNQLDRNETVKASVDFNVNLERVYGENTVLKRQMTEKDDLIFKLKLEADETLDFMQS
jgi:hypothetical protein